MDPTPPPSTSDRRVQTLEKLLAISSFNLPIALTEAADLISGALGADKVDVFLYDAPRDTLTALGSSTQPLSVLQRSHGLDSLAVSNGGRVVQTFQTGVTFATGALDTDPEELRGIRQLLQVRSVIHVALQVGVARRGVLSIASQKPNLWNAHDVLFAEAVAAWVSTLAHRAELVEDIARNAIAQGRRAAAEELVTVVAHDLRGYIAPVDLRLHLLERRAQAEERATDLRDIELARRALARAGTLIADLLDVARIDQGVLSLDAATVDLAELLQDLATTVSTPDHPVEVLIKGVGIVHGDASRLRQCIHNLLSNAIKFSPRSTKITVILSAFPTPPIDNVKVEVIDEGPGIAPEIVPHLFERFTTSSDKRAVGLGLGLFLAKQIALLHGGDLTVTSSSRGAHFELRLPCIDRP